MAIVLIWIEKGKAKAEIRAMMEAQIKKMPSGPMKDMALNGLKMEAEMNDGEDDEE